MPMDRMPDRIDSRFRFVLLSASRAEQLIRGAPERLQRDSPKLARHAMREIEQDLVEWGYGEAPEPSEPEAVDDDAEAELDGRGPRRSVN